MTLICICGAQALAGEAGTSDDEDAQPPGGAAGPTYVEEQEQYRQAFLKVGHLPFVFAAKTLLLKGSFANHEKVLLIRNSAW